MLHTQYLTHIVLYCANKTELIVSACARPDIRRVCYRCSCSCSVNWHSPTYCSYGVWDMCSFHLKRAQHNWHNTENTVVDFSFHFWYAHIAVRSTALRWPLWPYIKPYVISRRFYFVARYYRTEAIFSICLFILIRYLFSALAVCVCVLLMWPQIDESM